MYREETIMTTENQKTLSHYVSVERNFQRAMRLDRDVSASEDMLAGYVAQGTARHALETMAQHILSSKQRAFTWTGPYGCGKSSLALLLCTLVGREPRREEAVRILSLNLDEPIACAFSAKRGWDQIILVGRQNRLLADLARALKVEEDSRAVITALQKRADKVKAPDGLLLTIDELGKYLEAECASENAYLLQEIAEAANRSEAKFVFLGILHQAVDVYASRLPRAVRDEWAKVQGRFVDIPLLSSSEETVELLGHALANPNGLPPHSKAFLSAVKEVACAFATRRPETRERIGKMLAQCWPLNPVTTLLLGPVSRRKFAQNERSIYSFLSAAEPLGFKSFITSAYLSQTYDPADYWDYLKENFENSILTTAESHRWLTAIDAIQRAELTGDGLLVRLAKSVALIDLFRTGSGIEATPPVLAAAVGITEKDVRKSLATLIEKKVVIERKYANAYALFAGSDFDIEASLREVSTQITNLDTALLSRLVKMPPVVAREHYLETGNMRWFDRRILPIEEFSDFASSKSNSEGAVGVFVLLLPEADDEPLTGERLKTLYKEYGLSPAGNRHFVLGATAYGNRIRELLTELQVLTIVEKDPSLEGDDTGRAEVRARINYVQEALQDVLSGAFANSVWYSPNTNVRRLQRSQDLVRLASNICSGLFDVAPIIKNELINRNHISAQIVTARRELMEHMVGNEREERLGFTGFPPALPIYLSIVRPFHVDQGGFFAFTEPDVNFLPLWEATTTFLKSRSMTTGKELFDYWAQPPFGLKSGPMPIIGLLYYLTNKDHIAVYLAGAFQSSMTAATIDEWLVDPGRINFRWVEDNGSNADFLAAMSAGLEAFAKKPVGKSALDVAKAMVAVVLLSTKWAQHSTKFTPETLKLKAVLAKASDPIQLIYKDIPAIYGAPLDKSLASRVTASLQEYVNAFPAMIERVREHLFAALDADPKAIDDLKARAENILRKSGNTSLDAFLAHIVNFREEGPQSIQSIISLASGRPMQFWTDREIEAALSRITDYALEFRKQEVFAPLRGGEVKRHYVGIAFSTGMGRDVMEEIELSERKARRAKDESARIVEMFKGLPRDIAFAALSEAGLELSQILKKESE